MGVFMENLDVKVLQEKVLLLEKQVNQLQKWRQQILDCRDFTVQELIMLELTKLSVLKRYKGYYPLVDVIDIVVKDRKRIYSMHSIYEEVAQLYGCNFYSLRNNIQKVIELSQVEGSMEVFHAYFHSQTYIPASEFIATVADNVGRQIRVQEKIKQFV